MVLAERLDEWFENRKQKQLAKERAAVEALENAHEKGRGKERIEGRKQGRTEALAEGMRIGRSEGQIAVQAKWEGWNKRRMKAERLGETFYKPSPTLSDNASLEMVEL